MDSSFKTPKSSNTFALIVTKIYPTMLQPLRQTAHNPSEAVGKHTAAYLMMALDDVKQSSEAFVAKRLAGPVIVSKRDIVAFLYHICFIVVVVLILVCICWMPRGAAGVEEVYEEELNEGEPNEGKTNEEGPYEEGPDDDEPMEEEPRMEGPHEEEPEEEFSMEYLHITNRGGLRNSPRGLAAPGAFPPGSDYSSNPSTPVSPTVVRNTTTVHVSGPATPPQVPSIPWSLISNTTSRRQHESQPPEEESAEEAQFRRELTLPNEHLQALDRLRERSKEVLQDKSELLTRGRKMLSAVQDSNKQVTELRGQTLEKLNGIEAKITEEYAQLQKQHEAQLREERRKMKEMEKTHQAQSQVFIEKVRAKDRKLWEGQKEQARLLARIEKLEVCKAQLRDHRSFGRDVRTFTTKIYEASHPWVVRNMAFKFREDNAGFLAGNGPLTPLPKSPPAANPLPRVETSESDNPRDASPDASPGNQTGFANDRRRSSM